MTGAVRFAVVMVAVAALVAGCAVRTTTSRQSHRPGLDPGTAERLALGLARDRPAMAEVKARLGEGSVIRFASGYEVWVYPIDEGRGATGGRKPRDEIERDAHGELVILFTPAGQLAKVRTRLPIAPD